MQVRRASECVRVSESMLTAPISPSAAASQKEQSLRGGEDCVGDGSWVAACPSSLRSAAAGLGLARSEQNLRVWGRAPCQAPLRCKARQGSQRSAVERSPGWMSRCVESARFSGWDREGRSFPHSSTAARHADLLCHPLSCHKPRGEDPFMGGPVGARVTD
ncbi:hypothetical protein JZ751_013694 [Albula glossodonta]|uniref:Uncharacterized protein n=1 Tax=Albula glossodonta TaxID=121402 RepID=A0A8T2P1K7_9TELE|nr:hypothetical protein JZ751_013694 [Albula glossodonta]